MRAQRVDKPPRGRRAVKQVAVEFGSLLLRPSDHPALGEERPLAGSGGPLARLVRLLVARMVSHARNFYVFLAFARRQRRCRKNGLAHPAAHELIGDAGTLRDVDRRFRRAGGRLGLQRADQDENVDRHVDPSRCVAFAMVAYAMRGSGQHVWQRRNRSLRLAAATVDRVEREQCGGMGR
jgi:hypothetical protein